MEKMRRWEQGGGWSRYSYREDEELGTGRGMV